MVRNLTKNETALFITLFVGVIIAVTFSAQIATDTNRQTELIVVTNESLDFTQSRNATGANVNASGAELSVVNDRDATSNFPISNFVMKNNNTGLTIDAANYTLDATQGNFTLLPNDYWNSSTQAGHNITFVDYQYKHVDYVDENASRSVIALIIIFAALAIVIFIIVMVFGSNLSRFIRGGQRI